MLKCKRELGVDICENVNKLKKKTLNTKKILSKQTKYCFDLIVNGAMRSKLKLKLYKLKTEVTDCKFVYK